MCGRYQFYDNKSISIRHLIEIARQKMPPAEFEQLSLFEVFPGQKVLIGAFDQKAQRFGSCIMKWGYVRGNGMVINARSETFLYSPFFADSFPCAIQCSGYYEWSKQPRRKYYFTSKTEPVYLAGICHQEADGLHFVILTEDARNAQKEIHDRQPIMLDQEKAKAWCKDITMPLSQISLQDRIIQIAA
ncbi:MAG: SOS response-associated peptidase family protein [Lactimicrobium massiliense]|nr:SOS response-associated peptidase family protein [Lactimicrobium massiliense]MDD6559776.1 SOS response-associated peptidase family protein [Lactimicrobium massiliense]